MEGNSTGGRSHPATGPNILSCFEFVSSSNNQVNEKKVYFERDELGELKEISEEVHDQQKQKVADFQEYEKSQLQSAVERVNEVQFSSQHKDNVLKAVNAAPSDIGDNLNDRELMHAKESPQADQTTDDWPQFIPKGAIQTVIDSIERKKEQRFQLQEDGIFQNQYDFSTQKEEEAKGGGTIDIFGSIPQQDDDSLFAENRKTLDQDRQFDLIDQDMFSQNFTLVRNQEKVCQENQETEQRSSETGTTINSQENILQPEQQNQRIKIQRPFSPLNIYSTSTASKAVLPPVMQPKADLKKQGSRNQQVSRTASSNAKRSNETTSIGRPLKIQQRLQSQHHLRSDTNKSKAKLFSLNHEQKTKQKIQALVDRRKARLLKEQSHQRWGHLLKTQMNATSTSTSQLQDRSQLSYQDSTFAPSDQHSTSNSFYQAYKNKQLQTVRKIRMGDYYGSDPGQTTVRGKTFKDMILQTLNSRKGASNQQLSSAQLGQLATNRNPVVLLDQMLDKEQQLNGVSLFKRGKDLKGGLIDINKVCQIIFQKQQEDRARRQASNSQLKPLQLSQMPEKQLWKEVMKCLEADPSLLLDAMPSCTPDSQAVILNDYVNGSNPSSLTTNRAISVQNQQQSRLKNKLQEDIDMSRQLVLGADGEQLQRGTSVQSHYERLKKTQFQKNQDALLIPQQERPFSFNEQRPFRGQRHSAQHQLEPGQQDYALRQHFQMRPKSKSQIRYTEVLPDTIVVLSKDSKITPGQSTRRTNNVIQATPRKPISLKSNKNTFSNKKGQQQPSSNHNNVKAQMTTKKESARTDSFDDQTSTVNQSNQKNIFTQKKVMKRPGKLQPNRVDWSKSVLKSYINNLEQSNLPYENDSTLFSNEDIDYMMNVTMYNQKEISQTNQLDKLFKKSMRTIQQLCEELSLEKVGDRVTLHYTEKDPKTLVKVMLRCKEFFFIRSRILNILQMIADRERILAALKREVNLMGQADEKDLENTQSSKSLSLRAVSQNLKDMTSTLAKQTLAFLSDYHKYFGKIFVYEGTDYLQVARREANEISEIISIISNDNDS